jgi:hypothetical protein
VWKGGTMSIAGRTTLINSSISNTIIYHMSMHLLRKTVSDKLDKQRRTFFWQGGITKRKYRLIKWTTICKSKKRGGLGIKNIRKMNISLLCKWRWRLENEKGLWQEVIRAKYLQKDGVGTVTLKMGDSPVWADLLKVKQIYLRGRQIITKNGKLTLIWKDKWLHDQPLCIVALVLFEWCKEKNVIVNQLLMKNGQLQFNRWLPPIFFEQWLNIIDKVYNYEFNINNDVIK